MEEVLVEVKMVGRGCVDEGVLKAVVEDKVEKNFPNPVISDFASSTLTKPS